MSNLVRPVERVGDVVVVGEHHRQKESRNLVDDVLCEYDFSSVCVEAPSEMKYKTDRGGAIGLALRTAEEQDIPRYYVDTPDTDMYEAFGSRYRAASYLTELRHRFEPLKGEKISHERMNKARTDVQEKFGDEAFYMVFEKREQLMAGRAKWAAEQNGVTLLVVGNAHHRAIVQTLDDDVEKIEMSEEHVRRGERKSVGTPLEVAIELVKGAEFRKNYRRVKSRLLETIET